MLSPSLLCLASGFAPDAFCFSTVLLMFSQWLHCMFRAVGACNLPTDIKALRNVCDELEEESEVKSLASIKSDFGLGPDCQSSADGSISSTQL